MASSSTPNLPILQTGASGSVSTPTWTATDVRGAVPSTAIIFKGALSGLGDNIIAMAAPNNAYGASTSTTNPPPVMVDTYTGVKQTIPFDMVLESDDIYYAGSATGCVLSCIGWVDDI